MKMLRALGTIAAITVMISGCAAGGAAPAPADSSSGEMTTNQPETESAAPQEADPALGGAAACELLDAAYLNDLMTGATTMLGEPYEFQQPVNDSRAHFCIWKEGSTGLSLQVKLEPAATSAIDDHSGRAYNLDLDPVAVPQDGPGTSAVLLTDVATDDPFPYGYFFVADDVTVFIESVGLDLGADNLRSMADEAAARLDES